jgi:hypothetical protein
MSGQELKETLIALYGKWGWQTKAAEALGVDASSIRRWTHGQIAVPGPVAAAVRCFLRERS